MSEDIRPSYYKGPFEPVKIIQHYQLPWELGDALAYILRAGIKNKETEIEDLAKARTSIQLRINYLQAQKDLTINIKCEDNLSPVLEEMHEKVTKIKEDSTINEYRKSLISLVELMGVKDGRAVYEFVDSILNIQLKDLKKQDKPKLISELKVGDEIKAISDPALLFNKSILMPDKLYKITKASNSHIYINSEYCNGHLFEKEYLHEYFHVTK